MSGERWSKRNRYNIEVLLSFFFYMLGLFILNAVWREDAPWRFALLVLPILPLLNLARIFLYSIHQFDEMVQKILTESLAFAAIATGFSCFAYLFVRDAGGPEFRAEWAFYLMWLYYGIGRMVVSRKYK